MLPEKRTAAKLGVGVGIVLQILGRYLIASKTESLGLLGMGFVVVGAISMIWGCMNYAMGKGHSKWLGFLGILSFIGVIILMVLPDRHEDGK